MAQLPIEPRKAGLGGYNPLRMPTLPGRQGFLGMQPGAMQPMQQEPFVWGSGGQRMTAEDIARARDLAEQQMMTGADFSPVGHWTQGLARVAQGIVGGFGARKADRAAEANAAESASIAQMLMGGGEGGAPSGDVVAQALLNPNLDPQTRDYAKMLFKQQNPKPAGPSDFAKLLGERGIAQGSPEWNAAFDKFIAGKSDPNVTVTLPGGGIFVGPQSELSNVLQGGGDTSPDVLPADFFDEPTIQNTPAPVQGANGMPEVMSREQFNAVANAIGMPAAEAWMKRNPNVRIVN